MKTVKFYFEITDTFGGEANYSWATRLCITAKSLHGALCKLSRETGLNWHSVGCDRYDSASGCTCAFLCDDYAAENYNFKNI